MERVAYSLHGFNVFDQGKSTTDALHPYLLKAGYFPIDLDYGWTGRLSIRLCNTRLAMTIAKMSHPDSIAVGHSNGCAIIHEATWHGASFNQVIYINPALNSDLAPGPQVQWFHIWFTSGDWITKLAKFIPFSEWGNMGNEGYKGNDERAINHDMLIGPMPINGHSEVFLPEKLVYWAPRIVAALNIS